MELINHFFNYYGLTMHLLIKQKEKFTTKIDKFLGIFVNFIIVFIIIYYLSIIIFHKNPILTTSLFLDESNTKINMDKPEHYFAFGTETISVIPFLDERLFNFEVAYEKYQFYDNNSYKLNITYLDIEKCENSNIKFKSKDNKKDIPISQLYCIKNMKDVILEGGSNDKEWKLLSITLKKCENNTNYNNCKSKEEIEKYSLNGYFVLYYNDLNIVIDDYYKPVEYIQSKYYVSYSSNIFKENFIFFRKIEIKTNSNILYNNYISEEYSNIESDKINSYIKNDSNQLLKVYFGSSNKRYVYNRKYTKIFEIFSYIYTNAQCIIIFFKLFNYYLQNILFKNFICSYFTIFPNDFSPHNNSPNRRKYLKNKTLLSNNTPFVENIKDINKNLSQSLVGYQQKINSKILLNDSNVKLYTNIQKTFDMDNKQDIMHKINSSKKMDNKFKNKQKINKTNKITNFSKLCQNQFILKKDNNKRLINFNNISPKKYNYKKKLGEFQLLINYLCLPEYFKQRKKMLDMSYENARWYFDIIRILKLYSDVELIKKISIDEDDYSYYEKNEKFCLNSQNIINIISNN